MITLKVLLALGIGLVIGIVIGGVFVYLKYKKIKRTIAEINRFHEDIEEIGKKGIASGKDVQKELNNKMNEMKQKDLW